jgi:DNA-binding PadR family transcriptional regulator
VIGLQAMSGLNTSCFVILGLLSKGKHSGYSLKNVMKKTSDFYWSESNAQIYPVLKKLETLGLVSSQIDEQSGARHKKVFSITQSGMDTLIQWLHTDCTLALYREEFLLQLSLAQHLSNDKLQEKINVYRNSVIQKLEKVNIVIEHVHVGHHKKPDQPYLLLTYDHIKSVLDAKISWCDKILKDLALQK